MNSSSFDHSILFGRVLISPLTWWQHSNGFLATNERRADDCYLLPPSLKENWYSDALLLFLPTHFQPGFSDNQTLVIPISLQIQLEKKSKAKQNKLTYFTCPYVHEGKISLLLPFSLPQSTTVSANPETQSSSDPTGGETGLKPAFGTEWMSGPKGKGCSYNFVLAMHMMQLSPVPE